MKLSIQKIGEPVDLQKLVDTVSKIRDSCFYPAVDSQLRSLLSQAEAALKPGVEAVEGLLMSDEWPDEAHVQHQLTSWGCLYLTASVKRRWSDAAAILRLLSKHGWSQSEEPTHNKSDGSSSYTLKREDDTIIVHLTIYGTDCTRVKVGTKEVDVYETVCK